MKKTIEERAKEIARWVYELDKGDEISGGLARTLADKTSQALLEVRNETLSECAMLGDDVYNLPTGVILVTDSTPAEVGREIAQAIRERIKEKV